MLSARSVVEITRMFPAEPSTLIQRGQATNRPSKSRIAQKYYFRLSVFASVHGDARNAPARFPAHKNGGLDGDSRDGEQTGKNGFSRWQVPVCHTHSFQERDPGDGITK